MSQFDARNISMVMDLYELTMAGGYFSDDTMAESVTFDVFYRNNPDNGGFAIFAGLEQVIEYVENFYFSVEDVDYLRSLGIFQEDFLNYCCRTNLLIMCL